MREPSQTEPGARRETPSSLRRVSLPDAPCGDAGAAHASVALRYAGAAALVGIAFVLTRLLWPVLEPSAVLFFVAVVAVAAWGGFGPAAAACLLASALIEFVFVQPFDAFEVGVRGGLRFTALLACSLVIAWLSGARRRAEVLLADALSSSEARVVERTRALLATNEELRREVELREAAENQALDTQADLRAISARLAVAEHEERRRIAGQLHDGTCQLLAAASIRLGTATLGTPESLAADVRAARELVNRALDETRSLSIELCPPGLDEIPTDRALAWLADRLHSVHGIRIDFTDDGTPKPISAERRLFLFHAVRELVFNAIRHAGTGAVRVSSECVGARLRVRVEDDGRGFDPTTLAPLRRRSGGFGLAHLRERARHVGAEFDIDAQPGRGSRVTLLVPLESADASRESAA